MGRNTFRDADGQCRIGAVIEAYVAGIVLAAVLLGALLGVGAIRMWR